MGQFPIHSDTSRRADAEHEDKCRRCGISCHLALPVGGTDATVVVPELYCQFLQRGGSGSWQCSVYQDRFELAPWCHHADEAKRSGLLARDCLYTIEAGIRRGKVALREPLLSRYWPKIMAVIDKLGVPVHIDQPAFVAEVERREGRPYMLVPMKSDPNMLRLVPSGVDK